MTIQHIMHPGRVSSTGLRRAGVLVLSMVVLTGAPGSAEAQERLVAEITPDSAYQAAIAGLAKAADEATFDRRVDQLLATGRHDLTKLTSQLLYFSTRNQQVGGAKSIMGQVFERLNAPKHAVVAAVVPHLDNRDEEVRRMTREFLVGTEDHSATRAPDFSCYRAIIEADVRSGRDAQLSLVRHMYESDPGMALLTMIRALQLRDPNEIKPILWAEHVLADLFWKRRYGFLERSGVEPAAVLELDKMSRHGRWWVRLYAAEIVRQHRELGGKALVERLAADPHALVRESIRGESKERATELRKE